MEIQRLASATPVETGGDVQESTATRRGGLVADIGEQVATVSEVEFAPGERTRLHEHTYGQILYVTRGRGVVANASERLEVETGDLIFIPPGEVHWHGTAHDDPETFAHLTYVIRDAVGQDTTAVGDIDELETIGTDSAAE